jgi:hypothetical protein
MLRTIIGIVGCLLGLLVGCAGLDVPQQPRFQIAEGGARVIVRSHSSFLSPSRLMLARGSDGIIGVRARSDTPGKWANHDLSAKEAVLAQLHDTLLAFLAPSCEVPF